jgi:PAS domain S-box-containing protein
MNTQRPPAADAPEASIPAVATAGKDPPQGADAPVFFPQPDRAKTLAAWLAVVLAGLLAGVVHEYRDAPGPAAGWMLGAWLLLGLPLAALLLARRDSRQSRTILRLLAAVEQSATGVVIMDEKGVICYVNDSLCKLSKFDRENIIGRHWMECAKDMPPDNLKRRSRILGGEKPWVGDFEGERKGGKKYLGHGIFTPVRDSSGKVIARITTVTDMTEITRQAGKLREAKERAAATDKARKTFLATMGHEVRTPLNGIIGFTRLLDDTDLTAEQREYVRVIHASCDPLLQLVENILDFTKLEQGVMQIIPAPTDVRALVEEALATVAARAGEKNLRLLRTVPPDVPRLVRCDPVRLRQVLTHLVSNAVKFTPAGEIGVSVRVRPRSSTPAAPDKTRDGTGKPAPRLYLEFTVRDTGIGISPGDQARLFQPFVQLDSSCARRHEGAGLGLVIARDIVRLMGGGMSVISEKNKGTLFLFTLPCDDVSTTPEAARTQPAQKHAHCDHGIAQKRPSKGSRDPKTTR